MSEDDDKDNLDREIEAALEAWELDFEQGSDSSSSDEPANASTSGTSSAGSDASSNHESAHKSSGAPPPTGSGDASAAPETAGEAEPPIDFDLDEEEETTRVRDVPYELIESLRSESDGEEPAPASGPPSEDSGASGVEVNQTPELSGPDAGDEEPEIDLEIGELLDDLEAGAQPGPDAEAQEADAGAAPGNETRTPEPADEHEMPTRRPPSILGEGSEGESVDVSVPQAPPPPRAPEAPEDFFNPFVEEEEPNEAPPIQARGEGAAPEAAEPPRAPSAPPADKASPGEDAFPPSEGEASSTSEDDAFPEIDLLDDEIPPVETGGDTEAAEPAKPPSTSSAPPEDQEAEPFVLEGRRPAEDVGPNIEVEADVDVDAGAGNDELHALDESEAEPSTSPEPDIFADAELDALAPPSASPAFRPSDAPEGGTEARPARPGPDRGAEVAKRTVRHRKPRQEHFPLIGRHAEALRARREMLAELAEGASPRQAAQLLVAAMELADQLGEEELARELGRQALDANPEELVALRAVRRDAAERGDWTEVTRLLETEAHLELAPAEQALALTELAEVQLRQLGDPETAARTATRAWEAAPSVPAALVRAEAYRRQGEAVEALEALEQAASQWDDGAAQCALLVEVGRATEQAGLLPRARQTYARAAEANPKAIDAWLGLARTARGMNDTSGAVEALTRGATWLPPEGGEAVRRLAARLLLHAGRAQDAVDALEDVGGPLALQTRSAAAAAAGAPDLQAQAVEAWAAAGSGTERALALVASAELKAAAGELDDADAALKEAALADGELGIARVTREVLARHAGDPSRLARAVQSSEEGGSLGAAAKVATEPNALADERHLLSKAAAEPASPLTAAFLSLDAAAGADELEAVRTAVRRQVERSGSARRVGPLMALATFVERHDQAGEAVELLQEARDNVPGEGFVLRVLASRVEHTHPEQAAAYHLEEASGAIETRSAFAATRAARMLAATDRDPTSALHRALDAAPYLPAAWALEPRAREAGDTVTLRMLYEQIAEQLGDARAAASHWVRAALLQQTQDPRDAVSLLERAQSQCPQDAGIRELLLRIGTRAAMSASEHAALLDATVEQAQTPAMVRALRLRAAAAHEDAGAPRTAAALYRKVLETHPDDPFADAALDRAEIEAGEHARVAERRFALYKQAQDEREQVAALEALADLDLYERQDAASAVLSLQSILEIAPGHIPSLRHLERYFMDHDRREELRAVEEQLVDHLDEADAVMPHARLAVRLRLAAEDTSGDAADALLQHVVTRTGMHPWLARRIEAVAREKGDTAQLAAAADAVAELLQGSLEHATASMRAARLARELQGPADAAQRLAPAVEAAPTHPLAPEALAQLYEHAGQPEAAAEAYEQAARAASTTARRAELWHRAGALWQDELYDLERARTALEETAELDVTHADVFDRLKRLLTERGDIEQLATLTQRRLERGGDTPTLIDLHLTRAELCEQTGDREATKEALRAVLSLESDRMDALRKLANLCLEDEDWRGAADALIRIARLRQDRDELQWVFFTLGDIYDRHMPDARRAEAAYQRVLKLAPNDTRTMQRLGELYHRQEDGARAVTAYRQLVQHESDPDRATEHRLRLAQMLEEQGNLRDAEHELDQARRDAPTDLRPLRDLANFYERHDAQSALAMHLGRAVSDLRGSVEHDPNDETAWHGLISVLDWRGRTDAARCCASAAAALAMTDVELARRLDDRGGVPGANGAAADPELDELLAPELLSLATRQVFRLAGDALAKASPFDIKALRAERVGRDAALREEAQRVARWFGVDEIRVLVTSVSPRLCVPSATSPLTVVLGRELAERLGPQERTWLITRAAKIAQAHLGPAVQLDPDELTLLVAALAHACGSTETPAGVDPKRLEDMARRVGKAIPRRVRDDLTANVLEMVGQPGFDPSQLGHAAAMLGDRVGLLAVGAAPVALGALVHMQGDPVSEDDTPATRVARIRRSTEAWSLWSFCLSDAHFEARHRTGADRS